MAVDTPSVTKICQVDTTRNAKVAARLSTSHAMNYPLAIRLSSGLGESGKVRCPYTQVKNVSTRVLSIAVSEESSMYSCARRLHAPSIYSTRSRAMVIDTVIAMAGQAATVPAPMLMSPTFYFIFLTMSVFIIEMHRQSNACKGRMRKQESGSFLQVKPEWKITTGRKMMSNHAPRHCKRMIRREYF